MNKLNVLLLGWEFSPASRQKQETSCYFIAQALAERVDLSVLLPHTDPDLSWKDTELTALDQIDLADIPVTSSSPRPLPYADEPYIKNTIPLYGSAGVGSQVKEFAKTEPSTETIALSKNKLAKSPEKKAAPANLFGYKDFEQLSLDAQVIEYARYTSRWATQRKFDLIYAYNYRTFLAGTELKLITGKKLILQVDSLSCERSNPSSKGWMYKLEKQALQKCDYILTNTGDTAVILVNDYGIPPAKAESLEEEGATPINSGPLTEKRPDYILKETIISSARVQAQAVIQEHDKALVQGRPTADAIWEVIQMVAAT